MSAAVSLALFLSGAVAMVTRAKMRLPTQVILDEKHEKLKNALMRDHKGFLHSEIQRQGLDIDKRRDIDTIMKTVTSFEEYLLSMMAPTERLLKITVAEFGDWRVIYEALFPTTADLKDAEGSAIPYVNYQERKAGPPQIKSMYDQAIQFDPRGQPLLFYLFDTNLPDEDKTTLSLMVRNESAPRIENLVLREALKQLGYPDDLLYHADGNVLKKGALAAIPDYVREMVEHYYKATQPPEYKEASKRVRKGLVLLETEEILWKLSKWFKKQAGDSFGLDCQAHAVGLLNGQERDYAAALDYREKAASGLRGTLLIPALTAFTAAGWSSAGMLWAGASLAAGLAAGLLASKTLRSARLPHRLRAAA